MMNKDSYCVLLNRDNSKALSEWLGIKLDSIDINEINVFVGREKSCRAKYSFRVSNEETSKYTNYFSKLICTSKFFEYENIKEDDYNSNENEEIEKEIEILSVDKYKLIERIIPNNEFPGIGIFVKPVYIPKKGNNNINIPSFLNGKLHFTMNVHDIEVGKINILASCQCKVKNVVYIDDSEYTKSIKLTKSISKVKVNYTDGTSELIYAFELFLRSWFREAINIKLNVNISNLKFDKVSNYIIGNQLGMRNKYLFDQDEILNSELPKGNLISKPKIIITITKNEGNSSGLSERKKERLENKNKLYAE